MSFDWGWLFMFACFVYSMFLHVPSSCQGLLLSSYLPCFAKPLHITVCCNVCFKFVQVLWLSSWSSIAPNICVSIPRLPAGRGSHYLLPPIFWCIYSRTLAEIGTPGTLTGTHGTKIFFQKFSHGKLLGSEYLGLGVIWTKNGIWGQKRS